MHATTFKWKLIIPQAYQTRVLETLHGHSTAGDFEESRSIHRMKKVPVFWFQCYQAMRKHCRRCDECLRCKSLTRRRAPMQSFTAGEPVERMALDIMGDLHLYRSGNKCVLVVMDYFTK